jgi:hypothetical protein
MALREEELTALVPTIAGELAVAHLDEDLKQLSCHCSKVSTGPKIDQQVRPTRGSLARTAFGMDGALATADSELGWSAGAAGVRGRNAVGRPALAKERLALVALWE